MHIVSNGFRTVVKGSIEFSTDIVTVAMVPDARGWVVHVETPHDYETDALIDLLDEVLQDLVDIRTRVAAIRGY